MKKTRAFKRYAAAAMTTLMVGGVMCVGAVNTSALDENSEPELYLGSVDGDSTITLVDAIMAQKYALSMISFTAEQKLCADVNEDGEVNHLDSLCIQKYSDGIPTTVDKFGAKWFEAEYKYIEHPAETEEVLVTKEAYTITEPLYEKKGRAICFACGADITDEMDSDSNDHLEYHLALGDFEDFAYTLRPVWLYYGTDEWVVKNEAEGMPKPDGFQGAEKARTSADILIAEMANKDEYEYGHRYSAWCAVCDEMLLEDIITIGFDDEAYEKVNNIFTEHKNQHISNGERSGGFAGYTTILFRITTVPEESYYETRIIKEAWTEKILIKEAGWY
ncbi:MAG: dockerin type I repeat-containing protein [Acutalibacteraceae bacterium]